MMAALPNHEAFSKHLNTNFRISIGEQNALEAQLSTVGELQVSSHQERFGIVFRGPKEPVLPQGTYDFEHDELGAFILFIVPIRQDDGGTFYEAVFNRTRKPE
jgi:hypothetical protein